MRKISIPVLVFISAVVIFGYRTLERSGASQKLSPTPATGIVAGQQTERKKGIEIVLDFGDGTVASYSAEASGSALTTLTQVTRDSATPLAVKNYSFGKLVETIGNKTNSKDKAWIFFVNGKSADKGADQYEVHEGDLIEWKYIKPNY